MDALTRSIVLILYGLASFVNPMAANNLQVLICEAGNNFGQAVARAHIATEFGSTEMGAQEIAMFNNLENAVRYVADIEAALPEPWAAIRKDNQHARRIMTMVERLREEWAGLPLHQRVDEVNEIYGSYLESLAYTYNTGRPDAVQKNANCDSKHFQLCYEYGKASIASETAGDPDRPHFVIRYHRQANSAMANIIGSGLALAVDGHPFDGHVRKVCCAFGHQEAWDALPRFTTDSPTSLYLDSKLILLKIIAEASPIGLCGDGHSLCLSSNYSHASIRGWDKLDLSCFDEPGYRWLKAQMPQSWLRLIAMGTYNEAQLGLMNLQSVRPRKTSISAEWYEHPARKVPEKEYRRYCPCGNSYKKVHHIAESKEKLSSESIGLDTWVFHPERIRYVYYSQKNKAAYFTLTIEKEKDAKHLKTYAYYQGLADCFLAQIDPYALPCNCSDDERTQEDASSVGEEEGQNRSPKEKWLAGVQIQPLRFYESSLADIPLKSRRYQNSFKRSEARYINWELRLQGPPPEQKVEFETTYVFYNADGSILHKATQENWVETDWEHPTYYDGLGKENYGSWKSGNYKVEVLLDGEVVSRGHFEVIDDTPVLNFREWLAGLDAEPLKFFESDANSIPKTERRYNKQFSARDARFINWELNLAGLPPGQKLDFSAKHIYYREDGSILWESNFNSWVGAEQSNPYYDWSYGYNDPGNWKPGRYRVEVLFNGQLIGSGNFEILD